VVPLELLGTLHLLRLSLQLILDYLIQNSQPGIFSCAHDNGQLHQSARSASPGSGNKDDRREDVLRAGL